MGSTNHNNIHSQLPGCFLEHSCKTSLDKFQQACTQIVWLSIQTCMSLKPECGQLYTTCVKCWHNLVVLASFPGLPHFCSLVSVQYNTRKRKTTYIVEDRFRVSYWTETERQPKNKKRGRPGNEAMIVHTASHWQSCTCLESLETNYSTMDGGHAYYC